MGRNSKGQITRRGFLAGSGMTLALPMLESLIPTTGYAQTLPAPRLLFVTIGNGLKRDDLLHNMKPHLSALADADFKHYTKPLLSLKNQIAILGGIHNPHVSYPCSFIGGGHGGSAASLFTCGQVMPREGNGNLALVGPSVDQVIGQALYANRGTMAALALGTPDGNDNPESWGFPYVRYTSYRKDNITQKIEPTPLITDPRAAFDALLAYTPPPISNPNPSPTPTPTPMPSPTPMTSPLKNLVDYVLAESKDLRRQVSRGDQLTLDRYLANVYDLQNSIANTVQPAPSPNPQSPTPTPSPSQTNITCNPGAGPASAVSWSTHPQNIDNMNEMIKLAFQCDKTRVINYTMSQCQSAINLNRFGCKTASGQAVLDYDHHKISHTHEDGNEIDSRTASIEGIVNWYMQRVASLLGKLRDTSDPVFGGTLLDNTLVVFTMEFRSGHDHHGNDLPVILAGGGAGTFNNRGKFLNFATRSHEFNCTPHDGETRSTQNGSIIPSSGDWMGYPISSLFLTIMQRMGVKENGQLISKFRDSVGTIGI